MCTWVQVPVEAPKQGDDAGSFEGEAQVKWRPQDIDNVKKYLPKKAVGTW